MNKEIDYPILYEGKEDYFFISYSNANQSEVFQFLRKMNSMGIRFWYDKGLDTGVNWTKYCFQKMAKAKKVLFFFDEKFFTSNSLQKEVKYLKNNKLKYCPVYYTGLVFMDFLKDIPKNISTDVFQTLFTIFNKDITSIILDKNNPNIIYSKLFDEAEKNNCFSELDKKEVICRTKKFAYLTKRSIFTESIFQGVQTYFSETQHTIKPFYIEDDNPSTPTFVAFENYLLDILNNKYDGVIMRPLGLMSEKTFDIFKKICEKMKVVLCDIDITSEQRKQIAERNRPSFVSSDFELGGTKIATVINQICFNQGYQNTDVFICAGPRARIPAEERSHALIEAISKNQNILFEKINLNNFNEKNVLTLIKNHFENKKVNCINNKSLVIYLGNDNVASYFAKNINDVFLQGSKLTDYKKIFIVGYDGIIGTTHNSILEETNYDFATVDTLPIEQGKYAAEVLIQSLEDDKSEIIKRISPKVIKKMTCKPRIENKASSLDSVLENASLFVFDLDGTIADTETLHWEAYKVLMEKTYSKTLKNEDIQRYIGHSEKDIYRMIEKDYDIKIDDNYFLENRLKIYLSLVDQNNLKPMKWVEYIFNKYSKKKFVLLTSQVPEIVNCLLTKWKLDEYIPEENRISAHNGKITKKDFFENPNKYVKLSNEDLGNTVVFEDSNHVAKIASDLGYTTIGISHRYNKNTLKDFTCVIDETIKKGLFVGLSGLDTVFHIGEMPKTDQKVKTNKYNISFGGPALKAAITCSQLGGNATLITGIGNNELSKYILNECEKYNIEVIDLMPDKEIPNISFVGVNDLKATRDIVSGQTVTKCIRQIPDYFYKNFDYCLYDCNLPFFTIELIKNLNEYSIPLTLDCGSWKDNIEYALGYVECAITSSGFVSPDGKNIFDLMEKYSIKNIARTNGSNPIEYIKNSKKEEIPIIKKNNVSTLGAGDVFHGAFCHYYYDLSNSFEDALKEAAKVATSYIS